MALVLVLTMSLGLCVSASAASYIPDDVTYQNLNGQQLAIKVFTLLPDQDPSSLAEADFEYDGFLYSHSSTVKEEQTFNEQNLHTETVTITTSSKNLEDILAELKPTIEYDDGNAKGTLALDHSTIKTEAAGYKNSSYTVTATKNYTGLDRNDSSYIDKTVVKDGRTLSLTNVTWSVESTALVGDELVPATYTAVATYSGTASKSVATGYITTADYTGTITASGISSIKYTVTYLGTPFVVEEEPDMTLPIAVFAIATAAGVLLLIVLLTRKNTTVYSYLKTNGIDYLDYVVATHAHSDHIGGLSGALNYAKVGTALCPVTSYDSETFSSFVKYLDKQGVSITVPSTGESFMLGSASVQILGPQKDYDDPNDTSIVLKVIYGETSFLFTGDAERTAEGDILDAGYDLSATVLKVGHHGSDTSTSYPFLREVMPEYAVIQVGVDNSYGHPTEDTLSRLRDADVKVYRNDLQGTIICVSDGQTVSFTTEKNESAQTNPTVVTPAAPDADHEDVGEYIGNKNSKKFHLPTCKNLPAEKNRVYLSSRSEAVHKGFDPCGNCKP